METAGKKGVRISPSFLTPPGRTPGGVVGNALGVVAVFSCGGGFNIEPGPGFFVPALRVAFYPAENCGVKKGGVNELGKLRSAAKRNGAILTL
jgi:hypothetical protein